jgi:hypothetical protein
MIRYQSIAVLLAVGGCALEIDGPPGPPTLAGEFQVAPFSVTAGGGFLTVNNESGLVYKARIAATTRCTRSPSRPVRSSPARTRS